MQTYAWVILKYSLNVPVLKDMKNNTLFYLWLEWFVGFCDADANFQVFPKKRIYHTKDNKVTEYYNIGYGFHIGLSIKAIAY